MYSAKVALGVVSPLHLVPLPLKDEEGAVKNW